VLTELISVAAMSFSMAGYPRLWQLCSGSEGSFMYVFDLWRPCANNCWMHLVSVQRARTTNSLSYVVEAPVLSRRGYDFRKYNPCRGEIEMVSGWSSLALINDHYH
jgi:hypothetical protein